MYWCLIFHQTTTTTKSICIEITLSYISFSIPLFILVVVCCSHRLILSQLENNEKETYLSIILQYQASEVWMVWNRKEKQLCDFLEYVLAILSGSKQKIQRIILCTRSVKVLGLFFLNKIRMPGMELNDPGFILGGTRQVVVRYFRHLILAYQKK